MDSSSPATPPFLPSSPFSASVHPIRHNSRPVASTRKPRSNKDTPSPSLEDMDLVTYLQHMSGVPKRRRYGSKACKRPMTPGGGAPRPILLRPEVSPPALYTYPEFHPLESRFPVGVAAADMSSGSARRPCADESTTPHIRRSRRQSPWLPVRPFKSLAPPWTPSASQISALRALESMVQRLPAIGCGASRPPSMSSKVNATPSYSSEAPKCSYSTTANCLSMPMSHLSATLSTTSPLSSKPGSIDVSSGVNLDWRVADPSLQLRHDYGYNEVPYSTSPMSTDSATSLTFPGLAIPSETEYCASHEDAPFVITPEYEVLANALFEEAVRSGAIEASMTVLSMHQALSHVSATDNTDLYPRQAEEACSPVALPHYPQYPPPLNLPATIDGQCYEPAAYPQQKASPEWSTTTAYTAEVPQLSPPSGWHSY